MWTGLGFLLVNPRTGERQRRASFWTCLGRSIKRTPRRPLERCLIFPKRGETGPPSQRNDEFKEGRAAKATIVPGALSYVPLILRFTTALNTNDITPSNQTPDSWSRCGRPNAFGSVRFSLSPRKYPTN